MQLERRALRADPRQLREVVPWRRARGGPLQRVAEAPRVVDRHDPAVPVALEHVPQERQRRGAQHERPDRGDRVQHREPVPRLVVLITGAAYPAPNQPTLLRRLRALPWKQIGVAARERGRGHGRVETRTISVVSLHPCPDLGGEFFPHAAQAIKAVRRRRALGSSKWTRVTVYGITSLTAVQRVRQVVQRRVGEPAEVGRPARGQETRQHRQLAPHQQRHRTTGQEEPERRDQVRDRDVLGVGRPQHLQQRGSLAGTPRRVRARDRPTTGGKRSNGGHGRASWRSDTVSGDGRTS